MAPNPLSVTSTAAAATAPAASTMAIAQLEPQLSQRAGAADDDNHLLMKVTEVLLQEGQVYM